jgi:glutaconyl-CoA/methylmalonyl-CoA decarboxylase subunit gamma
MSDRSPHLRLAVTGTADLTVQLPAGEAAAAEGVTVTPLAQTPDDAAMGRQRYEALVDGWRFEVVAEPAARAALRERAQRAAAMHQSVASSHLRAQIPGRVARVWVADGDEVEQGQRLLAIEAMKMENEIRAPRAGRVEGVRVAEGTRVELNDELLSIV